MPRPSRDMHVFVQGDAHRRPDGWQCTSAVNLKFLSLLAASSFRNFKFKTALES